MKKLLLITASFLIWSIALIAQEEKLEVEGAIQIASSEDPTPDPGTIRWTGIDFEGWNGTCWLSFTGQEQCPPPPPSPTDGDGNIYQTEIIGTQEWLTTDLRTTKCNDGTPIPLVTNSAAWGALSTSGYSWYNNDEATQITNGYGAMYNWYAVNECNVCPIGYHVPTSTEWDILADFLGGLLVAGDKVKEAGLVHWVSPNTGTNISGWSGLPGGQRAADGTFYAQLGNFGYWWSTSDAGNGESRNRLLKNNLATFYTGASDKRKGYSVRCLKD